MGVKFNKNGKLGNLLKKLQQINNQRIEVGYFQSQGEHSSAEIHYTEMMRIHEYGWGVHNRPVMHSLVKVISSSNEFKNSLKRDLNLFVCKEYMTAEKLFDYSAQWIVRKTQDDIFGSVNYLGQVTVNETPLVDTSELRDNFAWKVSFRGDVHTL